MPPAKRTVATSATVDTTSIAVPLQPLDLVPVQPALQTFALLEADLCLHLIERDEAVRAALCALIAGQNMVLIGPPGTAKTHPLMYLPGERRSPHYLDATTFRIPFLHFCV